MSLTVTAQQGGSTSAGIEAVLLDITGQSGSPFGSAPAGVTSATPSLAITPDITGSLIIGTLLALGAVALTPLAGTTFYETPNGGGLRFGPFHGTSAAGGTPQTMGSSTGTGISAVAIEIKAAPTVSSATPSGFVAATSAALGPITPAPGDLLVLLVASNGGGGVTTMGVSDTSGLTWTEHVPQQVAGDGYTGIWTATVPGGVTGSFGLAMAPMKESLTAAERIAASFALPMAPMKESLTATETGANIAATFALPMAPMKMHFGLPGLVTGDEDVPWHIRRRT